MAFSAEEQKLYDFAKASLPKFMFQQLRDEEVFGAMVKVFDAARQQAVAYFTQALILTADGTGADYLNQHAKDRGTTRQTGESDATLRDRLRNIPDALTRLALISAMDSITSPDGIAGGDAIELRRDRGYFGTFTSDSGTGGVFAGTPPSIEFEPDVAYARPVEMGFARSGSQGNPALTIASATSGGNDGTFPATGLKLDAVEYQNGSGVAETDGAAVWTLKKRDVEDNDRDGFARAFLSRGYRMGSTAFTLMIPFGCDSGTLLAINEMLRQKKGAGILNVAECMNGIDFPQDSASLKTALGVTAAGDFASIYDFQEASGNVIDHVGSDDLAPTSAPIQNVTSKKMGQTVAEITEDVAHSFRVAAHDQTTTSFGILVAFSATALPSSGTKRILTKSSGSVLYGLYLLSTGVLQFQISDGIAQASAEVTPPAGASFADGKLHTFYAVRNDTANEVDMFTTLGDDTGNAYTTGSITNAGDFSVGQSADGSLPAGFEIGYLAIVSTATLAEAIGTTEMSNFHNSMLSAGIF